MSRVGVTFTALVIPPEDIGKLEADEVACVTDMCAAFLNVEDYTIALSPTMKKARNEEVASPTFKDTRICLKDVLNRKKSLSPAVASTTGASAVASTTSASPDGQSGVPFRFESV